jgi:hypothetical protein
MPFFVNEHNKIACSGGENVTENSLFPLNFRVVKDLILDTGTIPAGSTCNAVMVTAYDTLALSLRFYEWLPALRQWDNELLLFPNCDLAILDCLQVITAPLLIFCSS